MADILDNRFLLRERIGTGEHAPFLATDQTTGTDCVVRELTLGRITDWKQLELFERQTSVLQQLDHPGIPRFISAIRPDPGSAPEPHFYLVTSLAGGTPIGEYATGLPYKRAKQHLVGLLEILEYLHSFTPPVLHRDITPNKVLVDGTDVRLVDFGAVQIELEGTTGGSTMVGTSGYTAPEQLMGRAIPASDIYAAGTTFVRAMTGLEPDDLPKQRMKLQWRSYVDGYPRYFLDVIDRMLEPDPDKRFGSASEVINALERESALAVGSNTALAKRPVEGDIELKRTGRRLEITFPARYQVAAVNKPLVVVMTVVGAVIGFFLSGGNFAAVLLGALTGATVIVGPVVGVQLASRNRTGRLLLDASRGYRIESARPGTPVHSGALGDIVGPDEGHGALEGVLYLATRDELLPFAVGCSAQERGWLKAEIVDFMSEHE